jgi:membrane protein implicated in regulation of membrane protease activity
MLLYVVIGASGLLLLLLMMFVGEIFGGDHDVHVESDVGGHLDVDHGGGPSIFSTRIIGSFLTAFGVGGVVARYYGLSHPISSGIGMVAGVILAGVVYQFARLLYSQQASSEVKMSSLVGQAAEVTVRIPEGGVGQITMTVAGERSTHIARSADGSALSMGTPVTVKALSGESVLVERVRPAGSTA